MEKKVELTIKDLAPYAPYGLNFVVIDVQSKEWITQCLSEIDVSNEMIVVGNDVFNINYLPKQDGMICKPMLIPLHLIVDNIELCEKIDLILEPNGLEINNFLLLRNSLSNVSISWMEIQEVLQLLYENHYDVNGLINKGLAIDKNKLKNE